MTNSPIEDKEAALCSQWGYDYHLQTVLSLSRKRLTGEMFYGTVGVSEYERTEGPL